MYLLQRRNSILIKNTSQKCLVLRSQNVTENLYPKTYFARILNLLQGCQDIVRSSTRNLNSNDQRHVIL